ncbi:hypothetical protein, partial [Actinomadura darangshiensis]|uniref:hypothetical protein n=1 Tax=Actinomadura darangshiensis TaxID=705336 RepID=UPI001A9D7E81
MGRNDPSHHTSPATRPSVAIASEARFERSKNLIDERAARRPESMQQSHFCFWFGAPKAPNQKQKKEIQQAPLRMRCLLWRGSDEPGLAVRVKASPRAPGFLFLLEQGGHEVPAITSVS